MNAFCDMANLKIVNFYIKLGKITNHSNHCNWNNVYAQHFTSILLHVDLEKLEQEREREESNQPLDANRSDSSSDSDSVDIDYYDE